MKQSLENKHLLKQNLIYKNTLMFDALDILKMSNQEIIKSVYQAISDNPLLEIEFDNNQRNSNFDILEILSKPISLKEHLFSQLNTLNTNYDEKICTYIIESLDKHGFFTEDVDETVKLLKTDKNTFLNQLKVVQSLDPIGVAATGYLDSLIIQAKALNEDLVVNILKDHLKDLVNATSKSISKIMNCSISEAQNALDVIHSLNPYPCCEYSNEETIDFPDIEIQVEDDHLIVKQIKYFHLHYNDNYLELINSNPVLKSYFDKSKVLINNIDKRNATIMLVVNEIFNYQASYFLYHDQLKPIRQIDVANKLGINQATVSRAIMNKYYQFGNQVYPISSLFVSQTKNGDSSDAIKKAIIEIIEEEDKANPLTDEEIVEQLRIYDFDVLRRTVNKYRKQCNIPTKGKRKRPL